METNGPATKLVHVLRHTFEPNDAFGEALEQFTPPGPHGSRFSFAVRSLVSLELPSTLTAQHRHSIFKARQALQRQEHVSFEIDKRFAVKRLGAQAFAVFFAIHNQHEVSSQEKAPLKNPLYEKHISDVYGGIGDGVIQRPPAEELFDVYTRVHASVPIQDEQLHLMAEGYRAEFSRVGSRLPFTIHPATLPGFDEEKPIRLPQNFDKAS